MVQCLGLLKMTSLFLLSKYPIILQVSANPTKSRDIKVSCKKGSKFFTFPPTHAILFHFQLLSLYLSCQFLRSMQRTSKNRFRSTPIFGPSQSFQDCQLEQKTLDKVTNVLYIPLHLNSFFGFFQAPDLWSVCSLTPCVQ